MNTYDLFKVVEVSVIGEIIVAVSILSAVIQYNLLLTSVKNSNFCNLSHVW